MLGRLEFVPGGRGKRMRGELYGVPLLLARVDPEGVFGPRRVRRGLAGLRRGGAVRALLPPGFGEREMLEKWGLRRVCPDSFLRAHAPELTAQALLRQDRGMGEATVALSGPRADGELGRTALALCPQVRRLVIDAPGGEGLARRLREQFGVPVLPPSATAHLALRLGPGCQKRPEPGLELFGDTPELGGLRLWAPGLAEGEREDIPLLSVLWEWGKLDERALKFT